MVMIYIIRHGETEINAEDRINDSNIDTGINEKGREQARQTGTYLKNVRKLTKNNCIIFTSPAIRTVQTALIIKNIIDKNIKLIPDERIIETSKGVLSGLKKDDAANKKYNDSIDKLLKASDTLTKNERMRDVLDTLNPKYKIEPIEKISNRLQSFFGSLPNNVENIIVVTHGGIMTSIIIHIMNILDVSNDEFTRGVNCAIMVIEKTGKQKPIYKMVLFPNGEHLAQRSKR
jgi:broad specificity phosphatase PhoE